MRLISFLLVLLALTLAAGPGLAKDKFVNSRDQQLGYREAYSFAQRAEKRDIVVGVEVLGKGDQKRYLGGQNGKLTALEVAISNDSRFRLYLSAVTLVDSANTHSQKPMGLDAVARMTGPSGSGNKNSLHLSILRNNLIEKSLYNQIIEPGQTIQGMVFVRSENLRPGMALRVDIQNLKRLVYLDITVPVIP
jgi:multidrug efflux pump subunit AcrA (membrane-fusion protein)